MIRPNVALVLCLALVACDKGEQTEKSAASEMLEADALLLKDIGRAAPELERRLMASIQVQDGLLLVRDPVLGGFGELYVLPANSSWVLSCGIAGLSVVFGNSVSGASVSGESTSLGNDIELRLVLASIDKKDCANLGLRLGKRLKATLQGDQPVPP
jgi:hypothetical protein